jgi:hypothetical protein
MATLIHSLLAVAMMLGTASATPQDETDVRTIIGGHFAVDHIGPKAYGDIKQRALASPTVYLAIIERLALAGNPDWLSATSVPYAIEWIGVKQPAEVKALAARLLPVYVKARATPRRGNQNYRDELLDGAIRDLRRLAR